MENKEITRAILAGMARDQRELPAAERSLDELERLLETAGGVAVARTIQTREGPDPATYLGAGKIGDICGLCRLHDIKLVVFDDELSPSQLKNIEDRLDEGVEVIDRTMLILDIFARHARSSEGKLQVELAQLKYTAPRLIGKGREMSRLAGGIGTRGPGESKLEVDRRYLKRRIATLEAELRRLEKNRSTMRAGRDKSGLVRAAIVGYTNAGKSTLLNRLTDAGVLVEDKLFATLDPTTRKFSLPGGESILLTDTVGFIRKLPHHLIKAFRSTLEETVLADILIIVVDASDPEATAQLEVTEGLLCELGAAGKPVLYVFNKCDLGVSVIISDPDKAENSVYVSALTGQGLEQFTKKLEALVLSGRRRVEYLIPHERAAALNILYERATVEYVGYTGEGIVAIASVDPKTRGMMKEFER
ncbi:MAG: GTPase HflX [Eubacteriales bacterium]|jgi:GTP-binding protein HflX